MCRAMFDSNKILTALIVGLVLMAGADGALGQAAKWIFSGKSDRAGHSAVVETRKENLVEVALGARNFDILLKAADAAGLTDALSGPGPFTVFAPTDEAFKKLDDGILEALLREENKVQLQTVLKVHVVPERLSLGDAFVEERIVNLQGEELRVDLKEGQFMVNDVRVVDNDLDAANGVIHVIDEVLIPPRIRLFDPVTSSPRDLITLAINRGVPLFNNHQPEACSDVYEVTAQALLGLSDEELPGGSSKVLRAAFNAVGSQNDPVEKAWILRRALDAVYAGLPEPEKKTVSLNAGSMLIDDFSDSDGISDIGTSWRLLTDRVMGGLSSARSRYEVLDGKRCLRMQGDVSLENNGGFVQMALSLRPDNRPFDASGFSGVRLWVRGNGRPYFLHLRTTQNVLPWQYYSAPIETDDQWRSIDIPFSDFSGQSTGVGLNTSKMVRIAVVGAKKKFEADIAVARMEFYR